MLRHRISAYLRFLTGLRRYLNQPLSYAQAVSIIEQRLETRDQSFIDLVEKSVFNYPSSPWLWLFTQAGCSLGDLVSEIKIHGLEKTLGMLKDSGVYLSFEEYKGKTPVERNSSRLAISDSDLDNPYLGAGYEVTTGGSTQQPSRTHLDLDYMEARAVYDHLFFNMLDMYSIPLAIWYPKLPASTGVNNILRSAKIGRRPDRWFQLLSDRNVKPGIESRIANQAIILMSLLTDSPLPHPEPVPIDNAGIILDWILENLERHGRCALNTYVSQAVRISRLAVSREIDLNGTLFIVGSETMTPAKNREITASGAVPYARYMATEIGTIGIACPQSPVTGDYHLASDTVAVIQEAGSASISPYYFTSIMEYAPRVLINVQLGDAGMICTTGCSCAAGALGLDTHLRDVQGLNHLSCEGMRLDTHDLTLLAEELLPARFGGGCMDYQWVEEEKDTSLTSLTLRIAPGLEIPEEDAVIEFVLETIGNRNRAHRLMAGLFRESGTIRITRQNPVVTQRGKFLSIIRRQQIQGSNT